MYVINLPDIEIRAYVRLTPIFRKWLGVEWNGPAPDGVLRVLLLFNQHLCHNLSSGAFTAQ